MPENNSNRFELKKRRIRRFFFNLDSPKKEKDEIQDVQAEIINVGMKYRQMYLPVAEITEEFEETIRKKVEENILKAKLRKATEEDLNNVSILYNRAWMTSNTPFSPISIETLKKIFDYPEIVILIARVFGEDAGFVILDFEGPRHEYGIIAGMGVLPRY